MKPAILTDTHMHSSFSADSETPMEEMIRGAIARGLSDICFTEHLDPDYPATPEQLLFDLDLPAYSERLHFLQEMYRKKISVHFGIELGLQPHLAASFTDLLSRYSFDYVIGSSHLVDGRDPYYPDFFEDYSEAEGYLLYFESILSNLSSFSEMDAYGHLDYIVRYGPNQNRYYSYAKYGEILTAILEELIRRNIALEINTGGFAYGLGQPNPCEDVIRRYRELGGKLITIGADAHRPDRIAYDFPRTAELLLHCGFTEYCYFRERKPIFLPLNCTKKEYRPRPV